MMINFLLATLPQIDTSGLPQVATGGTSPVPSILNIVFTIVGALTLAFVTYGGFKYVISRGEPQSVARAKDTILYALIGLAVTLLASAIVNFVIFRV